LLQSLTICGGDDGSPVSDQALAFKFLQGNRHTGSLHTQHDGSELVSKRQLVAVNAIMSQQQPAGQALFDLAPSVGQGRLSSLRHE
jgi:hypothetical protein